MKATGPMCCHIKRPERDISHHGVIVHIDIVRFYSDIIYICMTLYIYILDVFEIFDVSVLSAKDVYIYIYVCTNRLLSDTDIHDMTNLSISTYMA